MKIIQFLFIAALAAPGGMPSFAQAQRAEVPGDHFSLEGALELFKKSSSPEEFEKMLNSPDTKVNNLDLNGDGYIDYVRVIDHYEGNVHAFVLQALIADRETQDVAVIELEKLSNGKAVLQIVGDEDVYGVTTIIEPTREVRTYAGTRSTPAVVNVWAWPSVQYIYGPRYVVWASPWGWQRRPIWYRPWRPIAYVHYYPIWRPYRPYYAVCHTHRIVYAREIYRPYRRTSVVVVNRHREQITRYRDDYRNGRVRNDDRRFVNNTRSVEARNGDRRRDEASVSRRSSEQLQTVRPDRSVSRERTPSPDAQRNTSGLRRAESPNTPVTRPGNDNARSSAVMRNRPVERSEGTIRSTTREQNVPAEVRRTSPNVQRQSTPAVRKQMSRPSSPSVERSRPVTRPSVQQRAPQRERSVTPPPTRSYRQPSSRPSSVSSGRSSNAPKVQQSRAPGRSTGSTRSSDARRSR